MGLFSSRLSRLDRNKNLNFGLLSTVLRLSRRVRASSKRAHRSKSDTFAARLESTKTNAVNFEFDEM